jgi:hypothetical protein
MTHNLLPTFKAIADFVIDLNLEFGSKQKPLALYKQLIDKTTLAHSIAINKHINAFKRFYAANEKAVAARSEQALSDNIAYSERVFIDIKSIFGRADKETKEVIWNHLLTIWALIDPTSQAKQALKGAGAVGSKEDDVLANLVQSVGNMDPSSSIMSIMQSGMIQNIAKSMEADVQNGQLDMGKLMGSVQKMMGSLLGELNAQGGQVPTGPPSAELMPTEPSPGLE